MQTTSADVTKWRTPEEIELGSTEDDVLRAYGKPNYTHELDANDRRLLLGHHSGDPAPKTGTKSLEYRKADRTRSTEFGIRDGKVAWIAMFR